MQDLRNPLVKFGFILSVKPTIFWFIDAWAKNYENHEKKKPKIEAQWKETQTTTLSHRFYHR